MQRKRRKELSRKFYQGERKKNQAVNLRMLERLAAVYNVLMIVYACVLHIVETNGMRDMMYAIYIPLQGIVSVLAVHILHRTDRNVVHEIVCRGIRFFYVLFIILISVYPYPDEPASYFPIVMLFVAVFLIYPMKVNLIDTTVNEIVFLILVLIVKSGNRDAMEYDVVASLSAYTIAVTAIFTMEDLRLREYESARAKEEFLSRMSHDVRTPLNAVIGMTNLALWEADNMEQVRDYLHKIEDSSQYLLGLLNNILDSVKLSNGKMQFFAEPYTQQEFARILRVMFQPVCDAREIELKIDVEEFDHPVMVDKMRYHQIVFNLVSNAVKFTRSGGKIVYRVLEPQDRGEYEDFRFLVEDNGCGMSEEFQTHLFERFSQEKGSYDHELQGSGLGLSIVKDLVERMGGTISLQSKVGQGTRFEVSLCLKKVDPAMMPRTDQKPKRQKRTIDYLRGKRILVVEDNEINAEITRKILERRKIETDHAANGEQAVDYFERSAIWDYDAILMDIRMPVMDGLDATKCIRASNRPDKNVPIIALSANAFEEDIERTQEAGMDGHLEKPVNPEDIYEKLNTLFAEKEG